MSSAQLSELLGNLLTSFKELKAATIADRDGLIIQSKTRDNTDEDIVGSITAVFDMFMSRLKSEFGETEHFVNVIQVEENKFLFTSAGPDAILVLIAPHSVSDQKIKIYGQHVGEKVAAILRGEPSDVEIARIIEMLAELRLDSLPKGTFSEKIIVLGDPQVGKTSLIRRFVDNKFSESYISSIGVDILRKEMVLKKDETIMSLTIWDIGGQIQTMAPYRKRFYQGANMAFIQFDITRKKTFENLDKWLEDLKTGIDREIPLVLIANKIDLPNPEVTREEIEKKAQELNCPFILTSAKTGANVNDTFLYAAYKLAEKV